MFWKKRVWKIYWESWNDCPTATPAPQCYSTAPGMSPSLKRGTLQELEGKGELLFSNLPTTYTLSDQALRLKRHWSKIKWSSVREKKKNNRNPPFLNNSVPSAGPQAGSDAQGLDGSVQKGGPSGSYLAWEAQHSVPWCSLLGLHGFFPPSAESRGFAVVLLAFSWSQGRKTAAGVCPVPA